MKPEANNKSKRFVSILYPLIDTPWPACLVRSGAGWRWVVAGRLWRVGARSGGGGVADEQEGERWGGGLAGGWWGMWRCERKVWLKKRKKMIIDNMGGQDCGDYKSWERGNGEGRGEKRTKAVSRLIAFIWPVIVELCIQGKACGGKWEARERRSRGGGRGGIRRKRRGGGKG